MGGSEGNVNMAAKDKDKKDDVPKGAIILGRPAPEGSVAAAAERDGLPRQRKRGPGVQCYISSHIKDVLVEYSELNGVNQKHFVDQALTEAFRKIGIDVELRRPKVTASSLAAARGEVRE